MYNALAKMANKHRYTLRSKATFRWRFIKFNSKRLSSLSPILFIVARNGRTSTNNFHVVYHSWIWCLYNMYVIYRSVSIAANERKERIYSTWPAKSNIIRWMRAVLDLGMWSRRSVKVLGVHLHGQTPPGVGISPACFSRRPMVRSV